MALGALQHEGNLDHWLQRKLRETHGLVHWDQVAGTPNSPAPGTTFPASPVDGEIFVYNAQPSNGVKWAFQYRKAGAAGKKWEFIGGAPLVAEVATDETTTSASYAALATAGPAVALPFAGDYDIEHGSISYCTAAAAALRQSFDIGGTGAADADAIFPDVASANISKHGDRRIRKTGLTAVTLTMKYKTSAGTAHFFDRYMRVTPVRVSG